MSTNRNVPLGYLRTFVTLLVVLHHTVLAYNIYAPAPPASLLAQPRIWQAFPIVDGHHTPGLELIVGFNDTFFMSLMFLISGLFAWPSLVRKGAGSFVRDRMRRLGLPFLVCASALAPLAYYPAYLQSHTHDGFWHEWLGLGNWPAGPAWFLWVLLAFGCVAAALYRLAPRWGDVLGRITQRFSTTPIKYFGALLVVTSLVYLPMAAVFDPTRWVSFGPFFVQISRVLLYAVYFVAGGGLGASGLDKGILERDGKLARRWPLWVAASLIAFVFAIVMFVTIISTITKGGPSQSLRAIGNFAFVLTCACASLATIALFVRFARNGNRIADSLGSNAYGIYLYHYACVSWFQLAMLNTKMPGVAKAAIVFATATLVSWGVSASLRSLSSAYGRLPQPAPQQ
jgi:fucose 4-O-acetylase-like acetyltransferase